MFEITGLLLKNAADFAGFSTTPRNNSVPQYRQMHGAVRAKPGNLDGGGIQRPSRGVRRLSTGGQAAGWAMCLALAALDPAPASPAFGPPPRAAVAPPANRVRAVPGMSLHPTACPELGEMHSTHNGRQRVVWNTDTVQWLRGAVELNALPARFNVITSLPGLWCAHTQ